MVPPRLPLPHSEKKRRLPFEQDKTWIQFLGRGRGGGGRGGGSYLVGENVRIIICANYPTLEQISEEGAIGLCSTARLFPAGSRL